MRSARGPRDMEFIPLPAGVFQMGSEGGASSEGPVHRVEIRTQVQMSRCTVTQGQWKSVMVSNPSYFCTDDDLPVESISWQDAQQFIAGLNASEKGGYRYRLPTEAEWEYACRGGTTQASRDNLEEVAWHDANSNGKTHAVALLKPNGWGFHDMLGNVWEWVEDWYRSKYYLNSPMVDPPGPFSGSYRVIRGGGWIDVPECCRPTYRDGRWPGNRSYCIGFRLVRSPE
jgi:formylglycine-generating enzyme required for sulfatase activity